METSWHSYPSVYALGHKAISELFFDEVLIEEKVDGSQFSFGRFDGELKCRSKGQQLIIDNPEKMFAPAVEIVKYLPLKEGWTYRAEYLKTPKHNSLSYSRIPKNHLIIFDINPAHEEYLTYNDKVVEATYIGLEVVPIIEFGKIETPTQLLNHLEKESILGGQKIEGMVIKNYSRFGIDKKVLMGKYVSEAFKEVHAKEWKLSNPTKSDVVQSLIVGLRTNARWQKAVQHLKERGELTQSPKDIGNLIKEVREDISKECEDEIKQALFHWAKDQIMRGVTAGLPEWYKEELVKLQFNC